MTNLCWIAYLTESIKVFLTLYVLNVLCIDTARLNNVSKKKFIIHVSIPSKTDALHSMKREGEKMYPV